MNYNQKICSGGRGGAVQNIHSVPRLCIAVHTTWTVRQKSVAWAFHCHAWRCKRVLRLNNERNVHMLTLPGPYLYTCAVYDNIWVLISLENFTLPT